MNTATSIFIALKKITAKPKRSGTIYANFNREFNRKFNHDFELPFKERSRFRPRPTRHVIDIHLYTA